MKASGLLGLVILLIVTSAACGEVSTRVCLADGNTPLELADPCVPNVYRDIMVGTELTIIVSSDANGYWSGGLFIAGVNRNYGVLSGRDYNDITMDWAGSRFPKAGVSARVWDWEEDLISGFLLSGDGDAIAGDWFIIDFNATNVGDCNVGLYDDSVSLVEPIYEVSFHHVRTRDFNEDGIVNFLDLALFASYWQQTRCSEPGWCGGTDLDANSKVDDSDLILFFNYWLERTK
jgi:hypothetical protein